MTPLLLIAAVTSETRELQPLLQSARAIECAQHQAWRGQLHGQEVLLVAGGIGKANAAATTAVALERYSPHGVICFGSAGAYRDSGLQIGDLVLPQTEIMADEGVACRGHFLDFEALGFPSVERPVERFNRFPAPEKLHTPAARLLSSTTTRLAANFSQGQCLTVSSCSGTGEMGDRLAQHWQGVCENMEGAAVAQVCSAWDVPWLEVRAISNLVEDRDTSRWDLAKASRHAQIAVAEIVQHIPNEGWQS